MLSCIDKLIGLCHRHRFEVGLQNIYQGRSIKPDHMEPTMPMSLMLSNKMQRSKGTPVTVRNYVLKEKGLLPNPADFSKIIRRYPPTNAHNHLQQAGQRIKSHVVCWISGTMLWIFQKGIRRPGIPTHSHPLSPTGSQRFQL